MNLRSKVAAVIGAALLSTVLVAPAEAAPAPTVETHRFIEPPHKVERWVESKYGVGVTVYRGDGLNNYRWNGQQWVRCGQDTRYNAVTGCAWTERGNPRIYIYAHHKGSSEWARNGISKKRVFINHAIKHEMAHVAVWRRCDYRMGPTRQERVVNAYADKYVRGETWVLQHSLWYGSWHRSKAYHYRNGWCG